MGLFSRRFFPDDKWIRDNIPHPFIQKQNDYTPDYLGITGAEWRLVFVCDEMMRFRRLHEDFFPEDMVEFKATVFTKDRDFVVWKKKLGNESFPIPLVGADRIYDGPGTTSELLHKLSPDRVRPGILGRIKGELFKVRPEVVEKLDNYYLNGLEFTRERRRVLTRYQILQETQTAGSPADTAFVQETRCYMYIGKKDYWIKQLDGGYLYSPVGIYFPKHNQIDGYNLGGYYSYSRMEDATNS